MTQLASEWPELLNAILGRVRQRVGEHMDALGAVPPHATIFSEPVLATEPTLTYHHDRIVELATAHAETRRLFEYSAGRVNGEFSTLKNDRSYDKQTMESLFASAKHLADEQAVTIKAVRKDLPAKMKKFVDETTLERFFNRRLAPFRVALDNTSRLALGLYGAHEAASLGFLQQHEAILGLASSTREAVDVASRHEAQASSIATLAQGASDQALDYYNRAWTSAWRAMTAADTSDAAATVAERFARI